MAPAVTETHAFDAARKAGREPFKVKDLTLAQDAANAAGAATPLGKHAQELYKAFDAAGHGGVDFSGIIQHVRSLAGK